MNITEVKINDEIETPNGIHYLVRDLPYRVSQTGEMSRTVRLSLTDLRGKPTAEDGALELGTHSLAIHDFDEDTEVTLIRSDVQYRDVWHYLPESARTDESGVTFRRYPKEFAHAELVKAATLHKEYRRKGVEAEGAFRLRVKTALRSGMSVAEVGRATGLSRERIYQIRDDRR
ncbi:hypothetical protein [Streptomyces murinus]|uniref:hypothetical protein n=1 Tax=Streptomyces murinus TaxID=33900 RepID=UPI003812078A